MILHELRLDGVGPYSDRQVLAFAEDASRPVTLVGGLNGAGKTTVIRSLFHVLYGARSLAELGSHRSYGAYLEDAVSRDRDEASIELKMTIPGVAADEQITVRRRWDSGARRSGENLDVFIGDAYDEQLSESWDETIEQIAPLGVARLFFFDGERIEGLADLESAADSLRTAIGSLLGLDLVSQLQTDLVAVQRRVLREAGAASSASLDRCQSELEAAKELNMQVQEELDEFRVQLQVAESEHKKLENAARALGGDLVSERSELDAKAKESSASEDEARDALRELAADPLGPITLVPELLAQTLDTVETSRSSAVEKDLLKVLAERDEWILARAKDLGLDDAAGLKSALSADRDARGKTASKPSFKPRSPVEALISIRDERLTDWRVRVIQAVDALSEMQRATDDLDRRISRIPHDESVKELLDGVQKSELQLADLQERIQSQEGLLGAANGKVEASQSRRDAELAKLAEIEDGRERHERITQHAERSRETLELLGERIARRHVGRISDYTMQCLEQLLRKDRLVESVAIDPETFGVTLLGPHGNILPGALSAGERQLTALALLWALARAAGLPLPVVIDTPLGRLDAGHRKHVVERYLPAAGHQVVVLSTDTEIEEDLYERLKPSVGAEMSLEVNDSGQTTVVNGYLKAVAA